MLGLAASSRAARKLPMRQRLFHRHAAFPCAVDRGLDEGDVHVDDGYIARLKSSGMDVINAARFLIPRLVTRRPYWRRREVVGPRSVRFHERHAGSGTSGCGRISDGRLQSRHRIRFHMLGCVNFYDEVHTLIWPTSNSLGTDRPFRREPQTRLVGGTCALMRQAPSPFSIGASPAGARP